MFDDKKKATEAVKPAADGSVDVAALRADLAAAKEQIAKLLGGKNIEAEKNDAIRKALLAETKKEGGRAFYRIHAPFYSKGAMYEAGSIVQLPVEKLPSIHWQAVKDVPAPATVMQAVDSKSSRPSDRDVG